jgi:hypothetical protein
MMTTQAVAAAGTGALATRLPAGTVMTIAGVVSLLASMILIPHLRRPRITSSNQTVSQVELHARHDDGTEHHHRAP